MGVTSDVNTRHNLISNSLIPPAPNTMFPEPWVQECFEDVSNGVGLHNSAFLLLWCVCVYIYIDLSVGKMFS